MKKTLLGLSIIAVLSPATASAENYYIGGSYGKTEVDVASSSDIAALAAVGISVDEEDTGSKYFAGYRAHKNVAFEVFNADLGEVKITDGVDSIDIEAVSFGVSVLGIIPVTESFELFGKVGYQSWEADLSSTVGVSASADGTDVTYGVGATYTTGPFSFRAEAERYDFDGEDVDMLSAGIAYNF
jgi:hypothetical protein